jgi:hypothetical protein
MWEVFGLILGQDLTEGFHCCLHSLQANTRKVPQAMNVSFQILSNSSVILPFDAVYSLDTDRVFKNTHNPFMGQVLLCLKAVKMVLIEGGWGLTVVTFLFLVRSDLQIMQTSIGYFILTE